MSLRKSLLSALKESSLQKKEDPKAYAKLASTGFLLAHPVKINGKDTRHDNGIKYHASIKFFDKENDNTKDAHETASKLDLTPPNPKDVKIEPKVLKDRNGNDVYAIGLHGKDADRLKQHHEKFSHMGNKENYKWGAHISVPKSVHDEIKAKGHKTAHDAGIEFGHAELKRGPTTLKNYGPSVYHKEKLAASENLYKSEKHSKLDFEKGNKDITEKSLAEIQKDTAWTWASRAAACYKKLAETGDWKWKTDAEEYRHEAVEHAALIGDTHPTVLQEIHDALEELRNGSLKEAKKEDLEKTEKLEKGAVKNALIAGSMGLAAFSPNNSNASTLKNKIVPSMNGQRQDVQYKEPKQGEFPSKLGQSKPRVGDVTESLNYNDKGNFLPGGSRNESFNERQFGPYKVRTMIQGYGTDRSGSNLIHNVELSHGQKPDPKMAQRVAKEIGAHHSYISNLKPGDNYVFNANKVGENATPPNYETPVGYKKVGKSELEKGAVKNMLTGAAMATALVSPHTTDAKPQQMSSHAVKDNGYSREKMLNAISQVESSGGKNMNHKPTSMGSAYGKWAIMPDTVKETIKLNPDLKRQHSKALTLQGNDLSHYLQDNPNLERQIVDRHLSRLEHHFGQNPEKIAFSWNQGITGTNRALKQKQDINSHPYVQKFKQAYQGSK